MPELLPHEPGSPGWLAARRAGVTATDIVTIVGLSAWDSVYSLFWRKLGQVPDEPERDRWELGKALEPYAAKRWLEGRCTSWLTEGGLYRNTSRAWQMATPDALVDYDGISVMGVFESKSWADADRRRWEDGPPAVVRAQVLWQMDVMDVAAGHVGVVFLPSGEFRSYTIEHDCSVHGSYCHEAGKEDLCPDCDLCTDLALMRAAGEEFMARLRLELPPPDPDSSAATLAAVRARFARVPDKQADVDPELWAKYQANALMIDAHAGLKREYEIALREQAGEAQVLCVGGQPVARRIVGDSAVKAHTRHVDYLRRITPKGDDDAADA